MLKQLQKAVESVALRVYRGGAGELQAETAHWKGVEVVTAHAVLPKLLAALNSVELAPQIYPELVEYRLKTIICVAGIITKTLPVTRTLLIDQAAAEAMDIGSLAYLLVRSAAYIDFYSDRLIFLPNLFLRKRDRLAKSKATELANTFQAHAATAPDK